MASVAVQPPNGSSSPAENKPVGIIYPPPNIRETVDKAAEFLANKGPELEDRIRENEKHNPKFCFLNPTDPYHAYYQYRLNEVREGKASSKKAAKKESTEEPMEEETAPKEPEPFEFLADMPAVSAQDLDIMKLTAQFAARNGRQFINQLAQRESRNYQFDFLRPSHSYFPYFTELVKQYGKVLVPADDMKQRLQKTVDNRYWLLDRVNERAKWVSWQKAEEKKRRDEEEKERVAYASIDWHDFVVVETVEFTAADEQQDLPPPMSLSELENMTLAQKRANVIADEPEEKPGDAEMDIDDVDMEEESDQEEEEPKAQPAPQQPPQPPANFKVRTDYKPKVLGAVQNKNEPTQICPRCGEAIPVSEMDEHMRIELLDPKWKEQKLAAEAKHKDSNLLQEGTDVAKILKNFSGYRSDIFGQEETEIGKKIHEAEEEAKKRERVTWDGHTASINLATQRAQQQQQNMSIEEQIAQIQREKGFVPDALGPRLPTDTSSPFPYQPSPPQPPPAAAAAAAYSSPAQNMYTPPQPVPVPMPPIHYEARRPDDMSDPDAKRPRVEEAEESQEWVATVTLTIQTPSLPDKPEWQLNGQTITLSGLPLSTLISTVKDRITSQLGMPAGKQKLTTVTNMVLNNSKSLEFYNITDGTHLVLGLKDKGKK
ncbi:Pre-mRNA splicing factor PRP21 like protein-domain-containing protein [Syncephalastrum racemosum]|uniref:Pre-mRNA splicing factor PRP21 like protein-domain-containing protein n=1 Tax=Syncephalastrum racemosum TaxID=13706 RepID=A0A1X2HW33_SYNRA|nr:Pre-mRNA splicing factor PRP21 like protein-domain-containing protein [Syncephalastrum racemosum]